MNTYLFYDIETTGLNKAFDQVLHFAAIRTDLKLTELERFELKIKLNPDIVPAPQALITHAMGLREISQGMPEYEAIKQIHQWFNQPGALSVGYNSLGFDDEFLRFSFYRNLLPPYHHQFKNNCGRLDIYAMAVFYFLYHNAIVKWPVVNGKISLKLADLQQANGFGEGAAHHAMTDVETTLQLATCFLQEKSIWDYLTGYFNKAIDQERIKPAQAHFGLMVDGRLRAQNYQCPVVYLGPHNHYKNQLIWLRLDSAELSQTTEDTIAETTQVLHKKLGEPNFILPPKPRFLAKLCPEQLDLAINNKRWLDKNPAIFAKIFEHYANYQYPLYPDTDASARLYLNGFWNGAEEQFCQQFHRAAPQKKAQMTADCPFPLLKTLALRIIGRHWPEALSPTQAQAFADYLEKTNQPNAVIDFQGRPLLTRQQALEDCMQLRQQGLTEKQMRILEEFEGHLRG